MYENMEIQTQWNGLSITRHQLANQLLSHHAKLYFCTVEVHCQLWILILSVIVRKILQYKKEHCEYDCGKRITSCLFIRKIRWSMWAGEKSKGICLLQFMKTPACGRHENSAGQYGVNFFYMEYFIGEGKRKGFICDNSRGTVNRMNWRKIIGMCWNMNVLY